MPDRELGNNFSFGKFDTYFKSTPSVFCEAQLSKSCNFGKVFRQNGNCRDFEIIKD
jgi:hypothetical protein